MTVSIEYEAEKKLDLPYEKIIKEIVEASLDFEKCPYEAEVNVILTDNETIREIRPSIKSTVRSMRLRMCCLFQWLIMRNLLILTMWKMQWKIISIRKQEN